MATPSEALESSKKCHTCEVVKPVSEFLTFGSGTRAGRLASECTQCWSKQSYPPVTCHGCHHLRPVSDFDKRAANGLICKVCLKAQPDQYKKRCSQCDKDHPLSFYNQQTRTDYLTPHCKACDTEKTTKWHRNVSRSVLTVNRKRRLDKHKAMVYMAYGGSVCACCGETETTFLTLDHINNDGAEWRRKTFHRKGNVGSGAATYAWCVKNGFPPIFQILCWNCQNGKRFNGGTCPHSRGTCRDHSVMEVGSSDPKPLAPHVGDDMVRHSLKSEPVIN